MRFLVAHSLEAGISRDKAVEMLRSVATDPDIRSYRSFLNLADGKGICLFDAPDRDRLIRWLDDNKLPYDYVWTVDFEAEHGEMIDITMVTTASADT